MGGRSVPGLGGLRVGGVGAGGGVGMGVADFDGGAADVALVFGPGVSFAADCVVREGGVEVADVAVVEFDFVQRTFLHGFAVLLGFPAIYAGAGYAAERPVVARLSFAGDGDVRGGPEDAGDRIGDPGRAVARGAGVGAGGGGGSVKRVGSSNVLVG